MRIVISGKGNNVTITNGQATDIPGVSFNGGVNQTVVISSSDEDADGRTDNNITITNGVTGSIVIIGADGRQIKL